MLGFDPPRATPDAPRSRIRLRCSRRLQTPPLMTPTPGSLRGRVLVALLFASTFAVAQGTPAPGLRYFGALNSTDTWIVDALGNQLHTWPSARLPGAGVDLAPDGTLFRAINYFPTIVTPGAGGAVQKVAWDGTVLWQYLVNGVGFTQHHDVEAMPNGNVLVIVWEERTQAQAIAAGRNPALMSHGVFRPDYLLEIEPTGPTSGRVVWEWHVWDHLIQDFDNTKSNYGPVGSHPELVDINFPADATIDNDWNHSNGIDYDPIHDWVVISARHQSEIWIIDHGTTIAEAAGHGGGRRGKGGDLLYRWGNPQAYRAGTAADQILNLQHDPRFIPTGYPGAGHITVFNNLYLPNQSAVHEITLPIDAAGNFLLGPGGRFGPGAPIWSYTSPVFFSSFISSAQRLSNGNTLICSGAQQWLFEVTPLGQIVWSQIVPGAGSLVFHAHYTERSLWSSQSTLSVSAGGTANLDLVLGSQYAGSTYLLLGSMSGTSPGLGYMGMTIPLNVDPFLVLTATAINSPVLPNSLGFVPPGGVVHTSFVLPPGVLPPNLTMDFACAVLDSASAAPLRMSNPVPIVLVQ